MSKKADESFKIYSPDEIKYRKDDIIGDAYQKILEDVRKIIRFQQKYHISDGIPGFLFYGDVGLGKTLIAKVIAKEMSSKLIFIDGVDIARSLYGQSEKQISILFEKALQFRHSIILIDDCESIFPKRDWIKGESWHLAQNNVFFHRIDELDTTKTSVILTTNRYDLIDKAIKDRLHNIEFPLPNKNTLIMIAEKKCLKLNLDLDNIQSKIDFETIKSIRTLEKNLLRIYIDKILDEDVY
jgi:SpoVK/Ycf46/Vps4 family AAA+-type ATPase